MASSHDNRMNPLPTHSQLAPARVSIALSSSGQPALIEQAVRSVLAQTYPDIELIAALNSADNETAARIAALRTHSPSGIQLRIHHLRESLDPAAAANCCLTLATGEFFLLLSAEDTLLPDAIARLVAAFQNPSAPAASADIGLAWCPAHILRSNRSIAWSTRPGPALESPTDMLLALWQGSRGARPSGILLRTADALQAGGFQSRFGDLAHSALWSLAALAHPCVACVATPLVQSPLRPRASTHLPTLKARKDHANAVHDALLIRCYDLHLHSPRKQISIHRKDHVSAAMVSLLVQRKGRPGWLRTSLEDVLHYYSFLLRPIFFRRLLIDGWKLLPS